jgi:hypothetical protein
MKSCGDGRRVSPEKYPELFKEVVLSSTRVASGWVTTVESDYRLGVAESVVAETRPQESWPWINAGANLAVHVFIAALNRLLEYRNAIKVTGSAEILCRYGVLRSARPETVSRLKTALKIRPLLPNLPRIRAIMATCAIPSPLPE